MTITATVFKALGVEQKLIVLRLASNQSTLDQVRGGMRPTRSNAAPMIPLRKLSEREILALGNTAFHVYPSLTLKAPVNDIVSMVLSVDPEALAAAAAMSPANAQHLNALIKAMNPTNRGVL